MGRLDVSNSMNLGLEFALRSCAGHLLGRRRCNARTSALSSFLSIARSGPTAFGDQCACKSNASSESASLGNSVLTLPLCITKTLSARATISLISEEIIRIAAPSFTSVADNFEYLGFGGDVDAACRLVQDQNPRPGRHPPREQNFLLVSAAIMQKIKPHSRRTDVHHADVVGGSRASHAPDPAAPASTGRISTASQDWER